MSNNNDITNSEFLRACLDHLSNKFLQIDKNYSYDCASGYLQCIDDLISITKADLSTIAANKMENI